MKINDNTKFWTCPKCYKINLTKIKTSKDYLKYGLGGGWIYGTGTDQPAIAGFCFVLFFLIMISAMSGNYSNLSETKQVCSNKNCPSHKS